MDNDLYQELHKVSEEAKEAKALAMEAKRDIKSHEDICAIRYNGITRQIAEMEDLLKGILSRLWWAVGVIIATLIGISGTAINMIVNFLSP